MCEDKKTVNDYLLEKVNEDYAYMREKSVEERIQYINRLIDTFLEAEGYPPNGRVLSRLGDLMLYDYVEGDTRSNKMRAEEYPILSQGQYNRRTRGQNQPRSTGVAYVESPTEDFSEVIIDNREISIDFLDYLDREID